ncbi:hypothetical protein [Pelagicoccus mobilis]|uniref:Uncharacterized protein n=1 Tax=Pelagicoccus mobilis TaxID=415221 RepID=A0A934RV45_9BACT|nr:hypothetical protein [Pelagicoccus mobilis]MBK1875699.1 hypothetical protein [Pelagicoccus mobilis]
MSFETARSVTPESFNQEFQFTKRPSVRYKVKTKAKAKQTVNISNDTLSRAALRRLQNPYAPKQSYSENGTISAGTATGQFLSAFA